MPHDMLGLAAVTLRTITLGVAAAVTVSLAGAQPPKMVPPLPPDPASLPKSPVKDPTQAEPDLRNKFDPPRPIGDPARPNGFPVVTLKGRIIAAAKTPTALLEIDGKLHTARKGSVIGLGGPWTLQVVEVNATEVRVEFGPNKTAVTLP